MARADGRRTRALLAFVALILAFGLSTKPTQ
jgi:hypothetical protein